MESEPTTVIQLFKPERQYCVPFYQRAYVWNQEDQWSRLWADIQEKAEARLAKLKPTPHFMGAVVLDPQDRKKLIGVERVHIIDGQQRLTTLQFVIAALGIVLRAKGHTEVLPAVEACLHNSDERNMRDKTTDPFKVWPTFYDRAPYQTAIRATSLNHLRGSFPDHFTQQRTLKKIGVRHPPALGAMWFFAQQIEEWIPGCGGSPEHACEALAEALLEDLVVIAITLGPKDDAQVIFETLNGHGVELNATDLIRNYVFLRAEAEGADSSELYSAKWSRYESDAWKSQERRGRLNRPRMEWFVQTVLQAEMRDEVDQGRIYAEYQRFVRQTEATATAQLDTLHRYADAYEQLLDGDRKTPIGRFGHRFKEWDTSTTYVLALAIARSDVAFEEKDRMFDMLGSYLVRRAVCGLTNKNYNKVFLQLLKGLREEAVTESSLRSALEESKAEAARWPRDDEFAKAFLSRPIYPGALGAPQVRTVFVELENALRTERSEEPVTATLGSLDIDHMLPQEWSDHWPLENGETVTRAEISEIRWNWNHTVIPPEKHRLIEAREAMIATVGNLTLLHYGTNRAASNSEFKTKRDLFVKHSNLHLNRAMLAAVKWGETEIRARGGVLFDAARRVWRGPNSEGSPY